MLNEVKHLAVVRMVPNETSAAEIFPNWIPRCNQRQFLAAEPPFYLLFAGDCGQYIRSDLEVYQPRNVVFAGESRYEHVLMLIYATLKVICDAYIDSS